MITYLRILYFSFPLYKSLVKDTLKGWLTKGILISYRHKNVLYLLSKMSDNTLLKDYYKKDICKILTSTIQLAKKMHYNKLISQLSTKIETFWNVIKSFTNKRSNTKDEFMLNIERKLTKNSQILADTFNNYFLKLWMNLLLI
jgi:hypothetical protein